MPKTGRQFGLDKIIALQNYLANPSMEVSLVAAKR